MRFEGEAFDVEQLRLGATLHLVLVDLRWVLTLSAT